MSTRIDKEIERYLKAGPKRAAAQLMHRYRQTGTARYLSAMAGLAPAFKDDPEAFNALITNVMRAVFVDSAKLNQAQSAKILFDKLAPAYFSFCDQWAERLGLEAEAPDIPEEAGRVLIVCKQRLGSQHAPTAIALELARVLRDEGGLEVLVLDARDFPDANPLGLSEPFIANFAPETGLSTVRQGGVEIPVHHAAAPAYGRARLEEWVAVARDFAPGLVISQGSANLAGDLLSYRYPCLYLPSKLEEPITRAHLAIERRRNAGQLAIASRALLDTPPQMRAADYRIDPTPEKGEPVTRARLKIPDGAFVMAMVGVRLSEEIDAGFAALMADVLAQRDNVFLVICGTTDLKHAAPLIPHKSRLRLIEYAPDLRALYDACDVFVNPERQGGGRSAYLALVEGMPVLSLPSGDVPRKIGPEACVPDRAALKRRLLDLAADPAALEAAREKARARFETVYAQRDTLEQFQSLIAETRKIAAERRFSRAC